VKHPVAEPGWPERMLPAALLLGVCAVQAKTLGIGLFGDDFAHRRFILDHLHGLPAKLAWWNMFDGRVALGPWDPDPSTLFGRLPWWASPDFSFALLRPLSTASQFLDYLLWPEQPWAMHAHNIALFCAIVLLAWALYRRVLGGGWPVALAAGMFALDDANTISAAWIASRNTLLTALFVLLALWLYDRGVRGSRRQLQAAPLALLLAHASSEGAVVAWAYLLPYALCLDRRDRGARLRSLLPMAAVSAGWLALASALGYAVRGSGVYVDPRVEPGLFARSVLLRFPELLELQLGLPREYGVSLPGASASAALWASHAYLALVSCLALWALLRSPVVAFFALATALSLLPQCAAGSFARLLLLSSFAAHGLTASLFAFAVRASAPRWRALVAVPWSCVLLFVHGWVALELPAHSLAFSAAIHESVLRAASSLPAGAALQHATIMVLNYPDYLRSVFVGLYRREIIGVGPPRMHVLGVTSESVRLARRAPDLIELEPAGGYLLDPTTLLVRRPSDRFAPGQQFELGEARVEVQRVSSDGRPTQVAVRISESRAAALLWVSWNEPLQRFDPIALPALGQSIQLLSARH
jgi:hypothetical protein